MSWIWAALMPHPPVIIPEVGKGREQEATATLKGMERLCAALAEAGPDAVPEILLLLSPHQPCVPGACYINTAKEISGALGRFGAPSVAISAQTPTEELYELFQAMRDAGIPVAPGSIQDISADHGAIVPLSFLAQVFSEKKPPFLILANPSGLTPGQAAAFGHVLRGLRTKRRWALLASGDLSHRLKEDGPYGFNPAGPVFDKAVVEALRAGKTELLLALDPKISEEAGECGLRPALVLLGLCREPLEVCSYEGPFGVGYCTALWKRATAPPKPKITVPDSSDTTAKPAPSPRKTEVKSFHPYARLARKTVTAHLKGEPLPSAADIQALSADDTLWSPRHGCFVSIKNKDGSLRGCIGTFMPTRPGLDAEIMGNAIHAATRDHRFPPMRPEELAQARFSVDVLSAPELVKEGMELHPSIWGVIVVKGDRRGLLLPDLPGVDTVVRQLDIAAQKGGIRNLEGADIYRFYVIRHLEGDAAGEEA